MSATKLSIVALSLAAGLAACGDNRATAAGQDDFKRDLQLASSTNMDLAAPKVDPALLNSLETQPTGVPQPSQTVKRGSGNRAVRSQTPTVRATPDVDVAAVDDATDEVQTEMEAPVPEPTNEPVAVAPRPAPVPIVVQNGDGSGDYGTGSNGGGIYGPGSGGIGVVIRGGGVDGDRCEIHRPGRGRTSSGPVYIPNTGGIYIGSRIPTGTRTSQPTFPRQTSSGGGGLSRPGGFSRSRIR